MNSPRPTLSSRTQLFLHIAAVAIGWVIFGWGWWAVISTQSVDPAVVAKLVVATLFIAPLVTLSWVLHNRDIHVRKGSRLEARSPAEIYQHDWAGRQVHAKFDVLRQSQVVIISSTAEEKYFHSSRLDPLATPGV